jgi:hypothetical protein
MLAGWDRDPSRSRDEHDAIELKIFDIAQLADGKAFEQ